MTATYHPTATPTGTRGSATSASNNLLIRQVEKSMARMFGQSSPLVSLLGQMSATKDGNAKKLEYGYLKDLLRVVTVAEAVANVADTTIVLDDATGLTADMILHDPATGEQMPIESISSNTVTVHRNKGVRPGATAGAIAVDAKLMILQVARKEGGAALDPVGYVPTLDYALFQQSEHVTGITDIADHIMHYLENPRDINRHAALEQAQRLWEKQFLFGVRQEHAVGSASSVGGVYGRQIAGGLVNDYIPNWNNQSNMFDAEGSFTYSEFCDDMREWTRPLSGVKNFAAFGSRQVCDIMNRWAMQYHQADMVKSNVFGVDIPRIKGMGWMVHLYPSEAFEVDGYHNYLVVQAMDARFIRKVTLSGLPDKWNTEITGPKKDGSHITKDQWTGVHTMKHVPFSGAVWTNIDA